jgi:hypothetical protein
MATETTQQEVSFQAEPREQHRWLQKLVGDWSVEFESAMEPGKPPSKTTGTERVRSLGDLWVIGEGKGEMPDGGPGLSVITLGYEPQTQRFVGTWIGSMMTYLWVYDGELDGAKRTLSLYSEGPSMTGDGSMTRYRETIEFKSDDHRVFTSNVRGDDGDWKPFMTAQYRRKR